MTAILISDRETETYVRRLAQIQGFGITEAVNAAARNEFARLGEELPKMASDSDDPLLAEMESDVRATLREYSRIRAKRSSRTYPMLKRHGVVETLRRLTSRPTEGLDFLVAIGREEEISFEIIVLKPKYERLIDEPTRMRARANLAAAKARASTVNAD